MSRVALPSAPSAPSGLSRWSAAQPPRPKDHNGCCGHGEAVISLHNKWLWVMSLILCSYHFSISYKQNVPTYGLCSTYSIAAGTVRIKHGDLQQQVGHDGSIIGAPYPYSINIAIVAGVLYPNLWKRYFNWKGVRKMVIVSNKHGNRFWLVVKDCVWHINSRNFKVATWCRIDLVRDLQCCV